MHPLPPKHMQEKKKMQDLLNLQAKLKALRDAGSEMVPSWLSELDLSCLVQFQNQYMTPI